MSCLRRTRFVLPQPYPLHLDSLSPQLLPQGRFHFHREVFLDLLGPMFLHFLYLLPSLRSREPGILSALLCSTANKSFLGGVSNAEHGLLGTQAPRRAWQTRAREEKSGGASPKGEWGLNETADGRLEGSLTCWSRHQLSSPKPRAMAPSPALWLMVRPQTSGETLCREETTRRSAREKGPGIRNCRLGSTPLATHHGEALSQLPAAVGLMLPPCEMGERTMGRRPRGLTRRKPVARYRPLTQKLALSSPHWGCTGLGQRS